MNAINDIAEIISRWDSGEGKPYKGSLIDFEAYQADPTNIGCMCAQGQVLHLLAGWSPEKLRDAGQELADRETAKRLSISVAHAILLRNINDSVDGAPSIVLTNPEKILGDQAHIVLAFWRHLDRMTDEQWTAAEVAAGAAWDAAWGVASAAWTAAEGDARDVVGDAARVAAGDAARDAASAAWTAASFACAEIQGARMREKGQPFFFLPMFGFADPEAVLAADQAK